MKKRFSLLIVVLCLFCISAKALQIGQYFVINGLWFQVTSSTTASFLEPLDLYDLNNKASVIVPEKVSGRTYNYNTGKYDGEEVGPFKVTSVGDMYEGTSCDLYGVKYLTLPNSITSILNAAYIELYDLEEITLSENLEEIPSHMFACCDNLKVLNFRSSSKIKKIGERAFFECTALKKIQLPTSLETIEDEAFAGCTNLEEITYGSSSKIKEIGAKAFADCSSLVKINTNSAAGILSSTLPKGVKMIKDGAFRGCAFTNFVFPDELYEIGESAFSGCSNLSKVALPEKAYSIGSSAFANCTNIEIIYLPSTMISIGNSAFSNCNKISRIYSQRREPTPIDYSVFTFSVYQNAKLYVHDVSPYKDCYSWSEFKYILDIDGDWRWQIYYYDITATGNGSVVIDPRTDFLSTDGDYYAIRWDFNGITIRNDQKIFELSHKPLTGVTIKFAHDKGYKVKQVLYAAFQEDEFTDVTSEIKPSGNRVYELFVEDKGSYPRFIVTFGKEGEDSSVLGDLTGDNKVDNADLEKVLTLIMNGGYDTNADLNGDGVVNVADVVELVKIINSGNGTGSGYFWMGNYNPNSNNFPTLNGKEVEGIVTTYTSLDDAMAKASRVYTAGEWAVVIYPSSWGVKDDLVFLDSVNKKYYEAKQKYLPDFPDYLYYESTERIGANATITLSTEGVAKAAGATLSSSIIQ